MIKIGVIIPCFRVKETILSVLNKIGPEVTHIYCVVDGCDKDSALTIQTHCKDPRVQVIQHTHNQGVGAATLTGYRAGLQNHDDILVKLDGDGQMDPHFIPKLILPIVRQEADYTKANRFYNIEYLANMPLVRKIGNAILSFMNKFSTGYWDIFDPTNGFTAIHSKVAQELDFDKIAKRYFFETDMLFRLNIIRAVVKDVPCKAYYGNETSHLKLNHVIPSFFWGHCRNFTKRILYNYFLRNFTLGSLEIILALILLPYGLIKGFYEWHLSVSTGEVATAGTVMFSALPIILGFQFLIAFFNQDMQNLPRTPLQSFK